LVEKFQDFKVSGYMGLIGIFSAGLQFLIFQDMIQILKMELINLNSLLKTRHNWTWLRWSQLNN